MDKDDQVTIEQRLDDEARIFIFPADEACVGLFPLMIGWVSNYLIPGILVGVLMFSFWRRIKGQGGLFRIKAALYWFIPSSISPFRAFPSSHVSDWRG